MSGLFLIVNCQIVYKDCSLFVKPFIVLQMKMNLCSYYFITIVII